MSHRLYLRNDEHPRSFFLTPLMKSFSLKSPLFQEVIMCQLFHHVSSSGRPLDRLQIHMKKKHRKYGL